LRLDGISGHQSLQTGLGRFVVLVFVVAVIVIVVATIHQIYDQYCSLAHGIQLKAGFQNLVNIEDARREVEVDVGILECEANFSEMFVMFICQFLWFCFEVGSIEDENAFAERQAELFSACFGCDLLDCCDQLSVALLWRLVLTERKLGHFVAVLVSLFGWCLLQTLFVISSCSG
jgi:hypothetical protein